MIFVPDLTVAEQVQNESIRYFLQGNILCRFVFLAQQKLIIIVINNVIVKLFRIENMFRSINSQNKQAISISYLWINFSAKVPLCEQSYIICEYYCNIIYRCIMSNVDLEDMDEKQRQKNKARLLAQNKKLNNEIRSLEKEIAEIVTARQNQMIRNYEQDAADLSKHRQQITIQEKYIKQLKSKIDFLKSANTKGNAQFIIKQEDDLLILKKQFENLLVEKSVVEKFKDDKLRVLDKDKPFEEHKKQIQDNLASVRKLNRTMQAEITQIERQVRKYHNYIVLNATLAREPRDNTSLQYQIAKNQHQIKQVQIKTKELEDKWKSQLDGLDKQLFQLKSNHQKVEAKLNETQKDHRMWETRKNSLRYEQQILEFRDRLSKIQILPEDKLFQNTVKSEKRKEKLTASQLIKLRKQKLMQKQKEKEKGSPNSPDHNETKSQHIPNKNEQMIVENLGSLRKSDKNIINITEKDIQNKKQIGKSMEKQGKKDQKKQKDKDKGKGQDKNEKQKNNKVDIKLKDKANEKQQAKQKQKKDKKQSVKKEDKTKGQNGSMSPEKRDKKAINKQETKSDKKIQKKPLDQSSQLTKQKSGTKLDKSTQSPNKQSPPKKQEKAKGDKKPEEDKTTSPKGKQGGNQSPKNKEGGNTKGGKGEQKKPAKLILKSVGVGTS